MSVKSVESSVPSHARVLVAESPLSRARIGISAASAIHAHIADCGIEIISHGNESTPRFSRL
jgi:hypothetical protein